MKQLPLSPMLATAGDTVPLGDGWRYEVKWDGIRAIVAVDDDGVHVWSRHGTVLTSTFPELATLADELPAGTVLDGELVVCDDDGRPDFRRVRRRLALSHEHRIAQATRTDASTFVAFDLLRDAGEEVTGRSWSQRRARLTDALAEQGPGWALNRVYEDGAGLLEATRTRTLEGVVAKRVDAPYRLSGRSGAWVKVKHVTRTVLPVVKARDDAVLVGDAESFRPIAWIDRFHPTVARDSLASLRRLGGGPVGLYVVQHLATDSGGLCEALVLALRPAWSKAVQERLG